jgi:murein DD-endopeptidase MepM/ murein hydrolase activator NlpD
MKLAWPLDKVFITQGFGMNPSFYARWGLKGHDGIDLRTRFIDSPLGRRYVTASLDGVVEIVRADATGYGTHIRLRHSDGSMTIYGHLTKSYVSKGQKVTTRQRIGLSGNTGTSTAPHLHFEYRPAGWENNRGNGYAGAIDPLPFMEPH